MSLVSRTSDVTFSPWSPWSPWSPEGHAATTDEDVVFVSDREDVHEVAHDLWRSEHAFGAGALGEVEAAAQAAAAAKDRLDAAVAIAIASGETWEAIGPAAGMARQSAQGRWGTSTDVESAGDG